MEVPPRLLSRGAFVSESLSTRRDSVRAPERLCVEDLLEPDDRLRELPLERLREDEPFLDFDEELLEPLERLLLRDPDFFWGILPFLLL